MGIHNVIIACILVLFIAIPVLAGPVTLTLHCDANHPNDNVVIDQVWEYKKDGSFSVVAESLHPQGDYDPAVEKVEFTLTLEQRRLASSIFIAVALDDKNYNSELTSNHIDWCNEDLTRYTTYPCNSMLITVNNYDKSNLHDNLWACWEDQSCIDDYLKAKKLIIRIEGDGP